MKQLDADQQKLISANLDSLLDRAFDANNAFKINNFDMLLAELYYARLYLDAVDSIIANIGKNEFLKMGRK